MKWWIQSFLLGVPKIIAGFRTREGILTGVSEIETHRIPETVNSGPNPPWNANMCVNFASELLDCMYRFALNPERGIQIPHGLTPHTGMRQTITDEGVWRIRRNPGSPIIEVLKIQETGHGSILTEEFKNWRIKLSLGPDANVGPS